MNLFNWIFEFLHDAQAKGDEERLRIVDIRDRAFEAGKDDPDGMLDALREGRALAQHLGESWWVLYFDHWQLQALLNYKLDYTRVLDLAARATLEARKPNYAHFPQRVCLHEDLIASYLGIDPLGHAAAIEKALEYMGGEVDPDLQCRFCVQSCRTEFSLLRNDLERAEMSARITLQMADDEPGHTGDHHGMYAHADLCTISHRRQDWRALTQFCTAGEELARRVDDPHKIAEFLVWQALLARLNREEDLAQRRIRQAASRVARCQALPGNAYYNALCAFHELAGDFNKALQLREHELELMQEKGRTYDECRCRIERYKLLSRLGLPAEQARREAESAARKLRDPAPQMRRIEAIASGSAGS